MSLQGFVCPLTDQQVGFEACYTCPARCLELPLLMSFMEEREKVPGVFSVTEILKPPRIVAWERTHDYYINPLDMVWATFGTAFHSLIEAQREAVKSVDDSYTFEHENYFEVPLTVNGNKVTLRGTPDQYWGRAGILTDYKTLKYYYDLAYLWERGDWSSSNYHWQVNMYRRFRFPDCKKMQLVALVKDWNRKLRKEKDCPPIVTIGVPWISDAEIDAKVQASLADILQAMADLSKARDCQDSEIWKGIRCAEYCLVGKAGDCPQYRGDK